MRAKKDLYRKVRRAKRDRKCKLVVFGKPRHFIATEALACLRARRAVGAMLAKLVA